MRDPNSLVYNNSLYLIECIIMSSVDILIAKHSSRDDGSDWSRLVSHDQILHTGRLSGEDIARSLEPECILHIACWMRLRDIDRIEVEILSRHLHRVIYIESHPHKCILHFSLYERDRMETSLQSLEWHCDVLLFCGESLSNEVFFDPISLCLECICDDISSLVRCFTDGATILGSEILESFEYLSEFARFTEYLIAIVDECYFICESGEMSEDLGLEVLDLFYHILDLEWHDEVTI